MNLYITDPLVDRRWDALVSTHPRASAFHKRGWLDALRRTYHYRPFVLTSAPPNSQMEDGIVLCEIKSWITGWRAVSLPFSDHCEPLLQTVHDFPEMVGYVSANRKRYGWKFAEIRPLTEPCKTKELDEPSHYGFMSLIFGQAWSSCFKTFIETRFSEGSRMPKTRGFPM